MKEEYSVKENKMEKEFRDVSEFNEESRIGENVEYATEGGYNGPEFQDYGEDKSAERLSRHSTLMRNNRNRLGRLLAMLTVVAGGAVAVMLLLTATVFVDVIRYKSQPESLYVELSLLSSAEDTEFTAVLTDREGHEIESVRVDPELPHLLFDDLTPGGFYYLEVFADGESKLKRNYILPEYPDREEETATPTPENTPVNETATPVNATEPPATDVPATDTPEATGTPTPEVTDTPTPDVTETPTGTPTPTPGPTDTPTPDVTETPTGTPTPTPAVTDTPTPTPTPGATDTPTPTPTPTPEPTETPTPVPEPLFSFVSEEKTFSSFKVTLTAENIDVSTLTATVNGNAATLEPGSNGRFTVSAEGLEPATEYTYTIKDSAGNSVYSGNITTANRTPASVTVTSENISYNSATLSFAITNPDSNPVTVKYDGTTIESSLTGSTYSREFTGLVTGATHMVEFVDWDGTVILSHSFAARDRQAATVTLASETLDFDSATLSFTITNPESGELTIKYDGSTLATAFTGTSYSRSFTGLVSGASHTIEFVDWNGSVIFTHTFAAKTRQAATVRVASETLDFDSATLSFTITNPDSGELTIKYDGTALETGFTGTSYSRSFTGLVSGASHTIEFVDWNGSVIFTHTFAAKTRQAATVRVASETLDFDSADLTFSITNPDSGELTIKYDGTTLESGFTGTSYTRRLTGLVSGENHTFEFIDWNGDVIFTHTFAAKTRRAATVTLASQEIGYDSAVLSFTITNPDSGELTIKYDGSTLESGFTSNSFNHSLTGLVSGVNHTFEFIDWNGDVIFTHTFAARDRTTATVTFSNVTPGFNSVAVELSVDNPDGNDLQLKIGSTVLTTDFTAATPTATATGLTPRTSYTLTVTDLSTGTQVATTTVETASSVTWEKNASGDYVFTFEDDFHTLYPRAMISVTDSKGYTINLTSSSENSATLAANDFVYTDSYTVTIKNGDTVVDTLTSNLSGSARPVFTLEYASFTPATIAEAYNDTDYHISYSGYPHFSYNLVSGLVQNNILDDGSFEDGPQRWTAMVIKDSSGTVMSVIVSGLGGMETDNGLAESGTLWIQPIDTVYDEIPDGTYTAALYTADGFTLDDMSEFLNKLYNDGITAGEGIPYVFTDAGRKISDDATFTKTTSDPIGDAWVYNQADPYVTEGPVTVRSFGGSYTAPEDGVEGFLTIVSASDPTVQLITPVSLGTSTDGASFTTGDLSYNSTGAVYIIIYSRSFSPENFLCVWYCESP